VIVPVTLRQHVGVNVIGPAVSETKRLRMLVVVLEDNSRRLLLGRDASVLFGLRTRRSVEWNIPAAALRDAVTAQRGAGERAARAVAISVKRAREQQLQRQKKVARTKRDPSSARGARSSAGARFWRKMQKDAAKFRSRAERVAAQRGGETSLVATLSDCSVDQTSTGENVGLSLVRRVDCDVALLSAGDASLARTRLVDAAGDMPCGGDALLAPARHYSSKNQAAGAGAPSIPHRDSSSKREDYDGDGSSAHEEVVARMITVCGQTADQAVVNAGENVFAARFAGDIQELESVPAPAQLGVTELGAIEDSKSDDVMVHACAVDVAVPVDGHGSDGVSESKTSNRVSSAAVSFADGRFGGTSPGEGDGERDDDRRRQGGSGDDEGGSIGRAMSILPLRPDTQVLGVICNDGSSVRTFKVGMMGSFDDLCIRSVHIESYDYPRAVEATATPPEPNATLRDASAPAVARNILNVAVDGVSTPTAVADVTGCKRTADGPVASNGINGQRARCRRRISRDRLPTRECVRGFQQFCAAMPSRVVSQARAVLRSQGYRLLVEAAHAQRELSSISGGSAGSLSDHPPPGYVQVRDERGNWFWFSEGAEQRLHSVWDDYPGAVDPVADCLDLIEVDFSDTDAPELGVKEIAVGKLLTAEQRDRIRTLLRKYAVVFRDPSPGEVAGFSEPLWFEPLDLDDTKPINRPQ